MINKEIVLPEEIKEEAQHFFDPKLLLDAYKHLKLGRVSISFRKGTPETYYIVSGIVRDDRAHEAKIVFKKRLLDDPKGPFSSNCDCFNWSEGHHCSHALSLYLSYQVSRQQNPNESLDAPTSSTPPIQGMHSHYAQVDEYGTIIAGPQKLGVVGGANNYSALQYLTHNNKVINFPIPSQFKGKLQLVIDPAQEENEQNINPPSLLFRYKNSEGKVIAPISIFENLYLFDWLQGDAYHLPPQLKEFIHKIRVNIYEYTFEEIIPLYQELELSSVMEIIIGDQELSEMKKYPVRPVVELLPSEKKNYIDFSLRFIDDNEISVALPLFLKSFAFTGGLLSSFKKKSDAYEFIIHLAKTYILGVDSYKKFLLPSTKKNRWLEIVKGINIDQTIIYDQNNRKAYIFDNFFIKKIFIQIFECFGEIFYRYSTYDEETRKLTFQVAAGNLLQGISNFNHELAPYGISIYYDRRRISDWKSKIRFERRNSATQWFELGLNVGHDDFEIIKNADMETGLALTSNGMVILTKEQKDLLKFIQKYIRFESKEERSENEGETHYYDLIPFNRSRIFELFELKKLGIDGALTKEEEELCERLTSFEKMPTYEVPKTLEKILRPYQTTGFNWLRFLYENQLGACLADDMGLGKTLQSIAFIESIYDTIEHVLVVCPVSILINWENEIHKFSSMKAHIYHGGDRSIPEDAKIVLTSYGVMKKEAEELFSSTFFDVLILDEVQHLKNIRSLGAYAARKLNARFRICLTGTPVENDLAEFYNILDLCMPGIWGDLQFVRTTSNTKSRMLARRTAAPFILRRSKNQVLTDLPPKIENNIYLSFNEDEQQDYKNLLLELKAKIHASTSHRKYGEILKGLLQLRQRCLWHPKAPLTSTKIEFLEETLEQILEEGHQAIVFSQFTTYLDYIQTVLREKHWSISRIDGSQSIKKRQTQVEQFQTGKTSVFLISLKAGGVGLNLTAASYVFIMDPWWNPAVENQAIDRAHRIGQLNTLTVYRPIIKDSVEEKVLELQEIKKELFNDLLPEDDEKYFTGKLSMKDFESLFN